MRAFDALPAIVWQFEGSRHVIVAANRAARASVGDRSGLLGRPALEAAPELAGQGVAELLEQVYATGKPVRAEERQVTVVRGVGTEPVEGFYSFTATPVRDAAGKVGGVLVQALDVTESVRARHSAQQRVQEQEQRFHDERRALMALMSCLLPTALPLVPGVELSACYLAASTELSAGGDWFDAVPVGDGRIAVSVGDVVGHGARAAAVMGQLRSALTGYLAAGLDPLDALQCLERYSEHVPGARGATATAVVLDPASGALRYASAGHPPLLLLRRVGSEFLPQPPEPPLGLAPGPLSARSAALGNGEALLLYTDGAVEAPGRDPETLRQRLVDAATAALVVGNGRTHRACDRIRDVLLADAEPTDDVALLLLRRREDHPSSLVLQVPAVPAELAGVRRALRNWLAGLEVSETDAVAVELAVGEAATNAVEHAYGGREPGTVRMVALLEPAGTLYVEVADVGCWRPPGPESVGRGRGLFLMRQCVDSVDVQTSPAGTVVVLRSRVRSPYGEGEQPMPPESPAGRAEVEVRSGDAAVVVVVTGEVDTGNAADVGRQLRQACRAGVETVEVDLTAVQFLGSSGVRELFDVASAAAAAGAELRVRALPGSGPDTTLRLTGFHGLTAG